jgi:hypothetical protein
MTDRCEAQHSETQEIDDDEYQCLYTEARNVTQEVIGSSIPYLPSSVVFEIAFGRVVAEQIARERDRYLSKFVTAENQTN